MNVKKKILIKGEKVHDVGYRLYLMNLAGKLEIEKFDADNIYEDGVQCVEVLVGSSKSKIDKFFDIVNKKENYPVHAKVDSAETEDYDSDIQSLESFRSGFIAYQQQKSLNTLIGVRNEFRAFRNERKQS